MKVTHIGLYLQWLHRHESKVYHPAPIQIFEPFVLKKIRTSRVGKHPSLPSPTLVDFCPHPVCVLVSSLVG